MGRPVCAAYVERDREIARLYTQEGKSLADLVELYGLSRVRLGDILENQGIVVRPEPRRKHIDRRPMHNSLVAMGARIHAFRMKEGLTLAECAIRLGLSEVRLTEAIQGLYNWKINEIIRAAKVTGYSLSEFVKSLSTTEWREWEQLLRSVVKGGLNPDTALIEVEVGFKERKNANNTWGVLTFKYLGEHVLDDAA